MADHSAPTMSPPSVASFPIPARPALLEELVAECRKPEPDLRRMASSIEKDPVLIAAVLRTVNSPAQGLSRRIANIPQAVSILGYAPILRIVQGVLMRQHVTGDPRVLEKFWRISEHIADLSALIARLTRKASPHEAHTLGLFHDIGIPVLMLKFPDYQQTLSLPSRQGQSRFTDLEDFRHSTNHALVGAMVARTWLLPEHLQQAIKLHHEPESFTVLRPAEPVANLIAILQLAHCFHYRKTPLGSHREWPQFAHHVLHQLGLDDDEMDDLTTQADELVGL